MAGSEKHNRKRQKQQEQANMTGTGKNNRNRQTRQEQEKTTGRANRAETGKNGSFRKA